ncbi:DUF63 family protein [Methanospirillum sp.]|uniref:DUF63 family protein n=1 Tax=Methanospirillum sp. TaxID=45200 RepID=UPI002D1A2D57|nr:DUF63 family protein [Methanospirillum sp.]HPP76890.1 DUF63 family protein [Methanospirillum sp.]
MISEFIYKYYIDPITYDNSYNIVNTLTYAFILLICTWLVYRWLELNHISIDREFVFSLIPWVVFGGFLRVVEDTGYITSDLHVVLITPLIYFLIFAIAMPVLSGSHVLEKRGVISSWKRIFFLTGVVLSGATLSFLIWFGLTHAHLDLLVAITIMAMALGTSGLLYAVIRYGFGWTYIQDRLYQILIFGHMLDASATSYGIDLHTIPYSEKHVVGSALIDLTGTAFVMFPLKLLVLVPGIYILELYRRDGASGIWYLILLAMIMVGLAPGIRDMMRMVLYV